MTGNIEMGAKPNRWRMAVWGTAAFLLLLPAVAMQFSPEPNWGPGDFLLMAAMLAGVCGAYEIGARITANRCYRAGVVVAAVTSFLLVFVNLAVGIIGSEDNVANLMFFGVLAIALLGSLIARFRAAGMARALVATACVQALVAAAAIALVPDAASPPAEILGITALFGGLWLLSAWLFRTAARQLGSTS